VTLALGSRPRQRFARRQDKRETHEAHLILSEVQKSVREWTLTLPRQLPLEELESRRTPESSGSDRRGQNPSVWRVLYIIGKLLKHRCLKWVCITHEKLSTRATTLLQTSSQSEVCTQSYGAPKLQESQFQDYHLEVLKQKNHLDVGLMERHKVYYKVKVVASPKSGPWWVLWVRLCPWFVLAPKVFQLFINQLVVWFVQIRVSD
jgi:hypothetical protein